MAISYITNIAENDECFVANSNKKYRVIQCEDYLSASGSSQEIWQYKWSIIWREFFLNWWIQTASDRVFRTLRDCFSHPQDT